MEAPELEAEPVYEKVSVEAEDTVESDEELSDEAGEAPKDSSDEELPEDPEASEEAPEPLDCGEQVNLSVEPVIPVASSYSVSDEKASRAGIVGRLSMSGMTSVALFASSS